jgi:2-polyprenyl-3-methyl-5-hydroxy-6-metoxy-1,4-benzoquinol methylase
VPHREPRTPKMEHEIVHGEWLAARDTEKIWGWDTPAGRLRAQRRAKLVAEGAQLKPGDRVLEIGCGTGIFTEIFAASGATIVAVDLSKDLLDKARARNLPGDQVVFVEKPFEECDVDGPFDAVIGSSVLHHLEIDASLRRILQLLKPGGFLSFAEPNMLNPQVFMERHLQFLPIFAYTSPDETAFVRWSFARKLRSMGFEDVAITPFDWLHPHTPPPLIEAVRAVGKAIENIPLCREFSGSLYIRARRGQTAGTTA